MATDVSSLPKDQQPGTVQSDKDKLGGGTITPGVYSIPKQPGDKSALPGAITPPPAGAQVPGGTDITAKLGAHLKEAGVQFSGFQDYAAQLQKQFDFQEANAKTGTQVAREDISSAYGDLMKKTERTGRESVGVAESQLGGARGLGLSGARMEFLERMKSDNTDMLRSIEKDRSLAIRNLDATAADKSSQRMSQLMDAQFKLRTQAMDEAFKMLDQSRADEELTLKKDKAAIDLKQSMQDITKPINVGGTIFQPDGNGAWENKGTGEKIIKTSAGAFRLSINPATGDVNRDENGQVKYDIIPGTAPETSATKEQSKADAKVALEEALKEKGLGRYGEMNQKISQKYPDAKITPQDNPDDIFKKLQSSALYKKATGSSTVLDADTLNFAAEMFLNTGTMPSLGFGSTTARAQILKQASQLAAEKGMTAKSVALNAAYLKAAGSALTFMVKQQKAVGTFEAQALKNADLALKYNNEYKRTGSPLANKLVIKMIGADGAFLGDPSLTKFETAIYAFGVEYAKVVGGGGLSAAALTDSARGEIERLLSASQTPEAFAAAVDVMKQEMRNRRDTVDASVDEIKSDIGGPVSASDTVSSVKKGSSGGSGGAKVDTSKMSW